MIGALSHLKNYCDWWCVQTGDNRSPRALRIFAFYALSDGNSHNPWPLSTLTLNSGLVLLPCLHICTLHFKLYILQSTAIE